MATKKRMVWNLEVTDHLDRQLNQYLNLDGFGTKSEFIRTAVREKLEAEMAKLKEERL